MAFIKRDSKFNPTNMTWRGEVTESNKYWYTDEYNAGATNLLCLPNCTTYAMGRAGEIAKKSCRNYEILNRKGFPNASEWWNVAKWERSDVPSLGAIACWTDNGKGWGGHVAVVESTDGTKKGTMLSMSGYVGASGRSFSNPGDSVDWYFKYLDFETTNYYYTTYNNRGGTFLGFLVNPYAGGSEPPTPPTPGENPVVTLLAEPSEGGYCTGGGEYVAGTEATFTAYPNSGYEFISWSDGYTGNPRYWTIETSFTLRAIFKKKVEPRKDIRLDNSITVKALEVLTGKYGSGFTRKHKLGKEYADVQYQVNYLIHNYSLYELLAFEVLVGIWGNGQSRKRRLEAKGYNYYKVQAYVNMYKDKNVL